MQQQSLLGETPWVEPVFVRVSLPGNTGDRCTIFSRSHGLNNVVHGAWCWGCFWPIPKCTSFTTRCPSPLLICQSRVSGEQDIVTELLQGQFNRWQPANGLIRQLLDDHRHSLIKLTPL